MRLLRTLLRTLRVRIGPLQRHTVSALSGGPWNKRLRAVPDAEPIRVNRPDGFGLAGRLYRPESGAGPHPAVLMLHGWDPQGQRHGLYVALADALARRGFVVMTMNLRGYPGSDVPDSPPDFSVPALTDDVLAALDFLAARPGVDGARVALLGHSYGAGLVIPTLLRRPSLPRAIIYGPSAWMVESITGPGATHRDFYHERFWRYMDGVAPIPMDDFLSFCEEIYIPAQVGGLAPDHTPLLLLDGGAESESALSFSALLLELLPPPVDYWSIPRTDHFCNCAAFGNLLVEDPEAIGALADHLETWLGWPR